MAPDERMQYLNWTPEEWITAEQRLFNVHPLQLQLMRINSSSVLMEVKTRLTFLAVSRGRKWQMYRTILALPSTYTHTHTLNPKALQGSVSSGAKNPSWGNPPGSSTLPAALPSNPIGSENPESACSTSGRRTAGRGALVLSTGALRGAVVPVEDEQLRHTGRFRDFVRPSCVQTR